ncbi:MAG: hypothetical protein R3B49_02030 [Phycisphaerales bacterium]
MRPALSERKLYYAVNDAEAYLKQAGWTQRTVVYKKEDTGMRFDLDPGAELPARGRWCGSRTVGTTGTGIRFGGDGHGIGFHTGWAWDWTYDLIYNTGNYTGRSTGS